VSDIVERLNDPETSGVMTHICDFFHLDTMRKDAADEITRLRAERDEAVKALEPLADAVFNDNGDMAVTLFAPTADQCIAAYFIVRRHRTAIVNRGEDRT